MLREKPNRLNHHVTFATCGELRRFVCTFAAQLIALQSGNSNLGFDCIGSHTVENYIGNVRSIRYGDNRAVTVERQVSRFELARHLLRDLCIERHIAKPANLGGLSLSSGSESDFQLDGNSRDFAIKLVLSAKIPLLEVYWTLREGILLGPSTCVCRSFLQQIDALMLAAPLAQNLAPVRSSTQGCQIVIGLHAFGSARHEKDHLDDEPPPEGGATGQVDPDLIARRDWTLAELEQFNHMIIEVQQQLVDYE